MDAFAILTMVMGFGIIFFIVIAGAVLFSLGIYLLFAFGLFYLAKNEGIREPWLAFIPVAQFYTMCQLIRDRLPENMRDVLPWLIIGLSVGNFFFSLVSAIVSLAALFTIPLTLALYGFVAYAFFELFRKYSENYILFFILTIVTFGTFGYIITFFIRNNKPITAG